MLPATCYLPPRTTFHTPVYFTRTFPKMNSVREELGNTHVMAELDSEVVDATCHTMVASWVVNQARAVRSQKQ